MTLEYMARIIESEASVLDFQGKLAVAQCIVDNRYDESAFAKPADYYSEESYNAAKMAVGVGARRIVNGKLLQFRSYTKYGPDGNPDWNAIYSNVPWDLSYLGTDRKGQFGHYYFGRWTTLKPFKLLVMAGHGRNVDGSWDPGAIGCGYQEANLTRELSRLIVQAAKNNGMDCDLAPDRNHYSFFKNGGVYDVTAYNYVLEVHFNASTVNYKDGKMIGSMCYIDQSEKGHSVEDAILQGLYDIGSKQAWDGVVVTQRQYPNGLMVQNHIVSQGVSHAVLETCFITDQDDIQWYQTKKQLIATKIVEGIIKGFGLSDLPNPYGYVGKGIATAEALEDMNVRESPNVFGTYAGVVRKGQFVEVLEILESGWLKIVWPGSPYGFAYTSNVRGVYYRLL